MLTTSLRPSGPLKVSSGHPYTLKGRTCLTAASTSALWQSALSTAPASRVLDSSVSPSCGVGSSNGSARSSTVSCRRPSRTETMALRRSAAAWRRRWCSDVSGWISLRGRGRWGVKEAQTVASERSNAATHATHAPLRWSQSRCEQIARPLFGWAAYQRLNALIASHQRSSMCMD
jgi:hypothetical protein